VIYSSFPNDEKFSSFQQKPNLSVQYLNNINKGFAGGSEAIDVIDGRDRHGAPFWVSWHVEFYVGCVQGKLLLIV
jgi:hypothetical protein